MQITRLPRTQVLVRPRLDDNVNSTGPPPPGPPPTGA